MIRELRIGDLSQSCVHHAQSVPFFKNRLKIEFQPGLNILWGGNGTGKSTILTALARMLHCEQGGRTVVTKASMNAVFHVLGHFTGDSMADGLMPVHDGQAVLHFDPSHAVGLACGGAAFDWDFANAGIANSQFRGSSGQTTLSRIGETLATIVQPTHWPPIQWKVAQTDPRTKSVETFLNGTIERGQPTVLLDEPDRSLSMQLQAALWSSLATRHAFNVQVIAAAHSPFALHLPGAHYIEMTPGYLESCERVLDTYILEFLKRKTS